MISITSDFATEEIKLAQQWLGCKADKGTPNESACINQITDYFGQEPVDEPWCAKFAWLIVDQTSKLFNVTNRLPKTASTVTMKDQAWQPPHNLTVDENPAPGCVFYRSRGAGIGHVGFVIEVLPDGTLNTIEGNHNNAVGYGHRDPSKDSTFRFIHTEDMAGGKLLYFGQPLSTVAIAAGVLIAGGYSWWRFG